MPVPAVAVFTTGVRAVEFARVPVLCGCVVAEATACGVAVVVAAAEAAMIGSAIDASFPVDIKTCPIRSACSACIAKVRFLSPVTYQHSVVLPPPVRGRSVPHHDAWGTRLKTSIHISSCIYQQSGESCLIYYKWMGK